MATPSINAFVSGGIFVLVLMVELHVGANLIARAEEHMLKRYCYATECAIHRAKYMGDM